MKRSLCVLLALCLLAALLSGCAGELPPLPPLPGKETAGPQENDAAGNDDVVVVTAEPAAVEVPACLELGFSLPAADTDEDLSYYFSPGGEFDCAFAYPSYCSLWVEKGAVRLDPGWFFARMFFTSVLRDDENAPEKLLDLLEPGKWGSIPSEGTAGTGWTALRTMHLKYDTWRAWVAWETPERYYLLYGSCFDGREEVVGAIFETIAASFRTNAELLVSAPESGALLRQDDPLCLFFDGAEIGGESLPRLELRLRALNRGEEARELRVDAFTADGGTFPFEGQFSVPAGEDRTWTLTLPLIPEEGGAPFENIGFFVNALDGEGQSLFELPVRIELQR
jgi:hypothetical protein